MKTMEQKIILQKCETCKKEFKKPSQLKRHLFVHTGDKPFECFNCFKRFSQKSSLETHKLTHSMEKPHVCIKCNQKFSQKGHLNLHLKRVHMNNKNEQFQCQHCSCCFKKQASLSTHLTKMHASVIFEPNVNEILVQIDSIAKYFHFDETNVVETTENIKDKEQVKYITSQNVEVIVSLPKNFREITDGAGNKMQVEYPTEEKKYICSICTKQFKHPSDLFRHNTVHSGERKFSCNKCNKSFGVRWNLKQHLKIHDRDEILKQECLKEKNRRYLTEIKNELKAERIMQSSRNTDSCELFYILPGSVIIDHYKIIKDRHCQIETSNIADSCSENQVQEFEASIGCHVKDAYPKEKSKYCEYCNKSFKKEIDLNRHRKKHTKEKNFVCEHCGKKFSLKGTLKTHIHLHMEERNAFWCAVCGRNFSYQSSLNVHMRIHTGVLPYKCIYCEKKFRTSCNREKHHNSHRRIANKSGKQPEETQTRISKVSKLFSTLNNENSTDSPDQTEATVNLKIKDKRKESQCKWCKKKFYKKSLAERHERIHTGSKPFKCDICKKGFNQKSTLKTHQSSHAKERNFKCLNCFASYKFKKSLIDHQENCLKG